MQHFRIHSLVAICAALFAVTSSAQATCYGTGAYRTCSDASTGNNYTINHAGKTTQLNGYNANTGSSWNQTTNRVGNSSFTNGMDSEGRSWNSTTNRVGNSSFTNGTDSAGRSWSSTTNRVGDSTTTTTTDSDGNIRTRTCNKYGCY